MLSRTQVANGQNVFPLSPEGFTRFAGYITNELGIKMPETKASMIQSRLVRRVRELGLVSLDQYGEYLFSSGQSEELDHFINAITTHRTEFFREPEHFSFLAEQALSSLHNTSCCLNVWSAACSSGEEPYTLAMVLNESAALRGVRDFAILATDVSAKILERASMAIYTEEQAFPVPTQIRKKYFLRSRDEYQKLMRIIPSLREKVSFHCLNLMDDDYRVKDRFDIIFLRNVLIYFDKQVQQEVINKLCRFLNPGGYLFLGHSESLVDIRTPAKRVHTSVYRMPD
jgi:chemotaxis protein methyltransferase CheR